MGKVGAPTRLNRDVGIRICDAIREGCYLTVAAARVGISAYTMYLWNERGKREAQTRDNRDARGEPDDYAMSIYEWFHRGLEAAKAEARFDAETRVFQTNPLAWLKNGYARRDWREANVVVQVVQDAVEKHIGEWSNAAFGLGTGGSPVQGNGRGDGDG